MLYLAHMKGEKKYYLLYRALTFAFGGLFLLTLIFFIAEIASKSDEFSRGMDAAVTLQEAQDYFLGDDDPHTAKITRNDGTQISLSPDTYSISVGMEDGRNFTLGSINKILTFGETTLENIVGLFYIGDFGNSEIAYVDPNQQKSVHLDDDVFGLPDIVEFSNWDSHTEVSYSIRTNVPVNECPDTYLNPEIQQLGGTDYFQGIVDECNKKGDVYLTHLLVNDEIAYTFPVTKLERTPGGIEIAMGYAPGIWIHLIGTNPELDKVYFEFWDKYSVDEEGNRVTDPVPNSTFSIDVDGNIEQVEFPDDMVTIKFE